MCVDPCKRIISQVVPHVTKANFGSTGAIIGVVGFGIFHYCVKKYKVENKGSQPLLEFLEDISYEIALELTVYVIISKIGKISGENNSKVKGKAVGDIKKVLKGSRLRHLYNFVPKRLTLS